MTSFLIWLQGLPLSMWVAQSDSLWAYPIVLFAHMVGTMLVVGSSYVIGLSMLGWLDELSPRTLQRLFPLIWVGLGISAVTGSLLFIAAASVMGHKWLYYLKLALTIGGALILLPVAAFLKHGVIAGTRVPRRTTVLAVALLICWTCVIFAGRLLAYAN